MNSEFRYYEAKVEKVGSHRELNPGYLWIEQPVPAIEPRLPDNHQLSIYCTGSTEWLSRTPGSHSVCACRHSMCSQNSITTCAVHIEYCEGWWLASCRSSMAEQRRLKPEVSWDRLPAAAGFFSIFVS